MTLSTIPKTLILSFAAVPEARLGRTRRFSQTTRFFFSTKPSFQVRLHQAQSPRLRSTSSGRRRRVRVPPRVRQTSPRPVEAGRLGRSLDVHEPQLRTHVLVRARRTQQKRRRRRHDGHARSRPRRRAHVRLRHERGRRAELEVPLRRADVPRQGDQRRLEGSGVPG